MQKIKILLFSGTKIYETFPVVQSCARCYSSPHILDRTCKGGGLPIYLREYILSKLVKQESFENYAFKLLFLIDMRK